MFTSYFKIAWRSLWKHRTFSFINIMGLIVGMTTFFLVFLYVKFELSYDCFHTKADRVYRLVTDIKTPTETINTAATSWAFGPNIGADFPEVESFVRLQEASFLVRKGNTKFQEDKALYADSSLFHVFDFKLVAGNPATALKEPLSVILSETTALKYFNTTDPLGQTLLLRSDNLLAVVTGIMQDIPENSQIKADMLVSMSTRTQKLNIGIDEQWGGFGVITYLLLKPGANPNVLAAKFPSFIEQHNGQERKQSQMYYTLLLEPLKNAYLRSDRAGFETGNINNVYIFSIIALFILLIAGINFVNLTTARSAERAKEVGVRKLAGAAKWQLIRQFTGESLLLCLIAFVLTLALSALLLPFFNQLVGKTVSQSVFQNLKYVLILMIAASGTGLLAGIYPSMVLSSFKAVAVLKGRFAVGAKGGVLRKGLVVAQFVISIAFIIGTIVVYAQMDFMRNQDLGFSKQQILILDTKNDPAREAFRQAIANIATVKSTSISSSVPGGENNEAYSEIENKQGELQVANLDVYFVDFDYTLQFNMKIVAGRTFSKDFATDSTQAMVLNETAVKMFGYASPQEAIGKRFKQWGREGKIIGVVKDFHFRSLKENIKPLSMRIEPKRSSLISANLSVENLPATIASIESEWKTIIPNRPFSYYFLDEFFDRQYRREKRFESIFFNFAFLSIFLSCLGLLGLSSYSTVQRTKEIGIRKVLGASIAGITGLLAKDFLKLVVVAIVIASPLAYILMQKWLADFAYRIEISWLMFAAAGAAAVLIAFLTVGFQSVKAALANPVKSLKSE